MSLSRSMASLLATTADALAASRVLNGGVGTCIFIQASYGRLFTWETDMGVAFADASCGMIASVHGSRLLDLVPLLQHTDTKQSLTDLVC